MIFLKLPSLITCIHACIFFIPTIYLMDLIGYWLLPYGQLVFLAKLPILLIVLFSIRIEWYYSHKGKSYIEAVKKALFIQ